jgi:cytochrome P450
MVIAEMLGIPVDDWPLLRGWAGTMLGSDDVRDDTTQEDMTRALEEIAPTVRELNAYLRAHIQRCRANPGDDLTGRLIDAQVDGERLNDDDILGFVGAVLSAGHITMTAMLTSTIVLLNANPDAAARLRQDPALRPGALDEVIRCRPPFPQIGRRTTVEVGIAGTTIPADAMITLWVAAANRDPARFANPDRFDIHRSPNPHLAYGHGIHFCVGAPLARLEASVVLDTLFDHYRDITIATEPATEFRNPWLLTTAKHLPLAVVPA